MKIFEADGFRFDVQVEMQDPAIQSLIGATVDVFAVKGSTEVEGLAVVASATQIRCTFAPGALTNGHWTIQVRAVIGALPPQTVSEFDQVIWRSLGA